MDGPLKILLVEDDPDQANLIQKRLRNYNSHIEVETVFSGKDCLRKLTRNHYETIILDYSLPEYDGIEILNRIKQTGIDAPVIIVSANGNEKIAVEALKRGAHDYLVKDSGYLTLLPKAVERAIEKNLVDIKLRKSERKNRELFEKVLESKNRLQTMFDGIEDIIYEVNKDYEIIRANKKFAELCNSQPENLIGKKCYDVYFNCESCGGCPVKATLDSLKPHSVEKTNGADVYDTRSYPIFNVDRKLESVAVYSKNITEKRGLEKSLIQSEKLATIGLLASGIAHELRNPLNVIETARYYIDQFLPEKSNDISAKLEIISKNVKRASKIINSLLEYSRHSEYENESIDLEKLVADTMALIEKEFIARNIEYIFEGKPNTFAYFNMDSLKQVLLNIIINAIQAMPNGGQLVISIKKSREKSVDIQISDTGVGIPEENLPRLFSPFFTTKEVGVGTGLGLYVSHMIIEREGGKILVDSKLNEGTTFTISLPSSEVTESLAVHS